MPLIMEEQLESETTAINAAIKKAILLNGTSSND